MKSRRSLILLVLVSLLTGILTVRTGFSATIGAAQNQPVHLIYSGQDVVTFELATNQYDIEMLETDEGTFQIFNLPGYGLTSHQGYPQLPTTSVLLGLPANGQVKVNLISQETSYIHDLNNLAPVPTSLQQDGDPNNYRSIYLLDQNVFTQADRYPAEPVVIEEYGWIRDQRFVRIGLYPFQFLPSQGSVLWYQRMTVEVLIEGDTSEVDPLYELGNEYEEESSYDLLLQERILNYDIARAWRTTPPIDAVHQTTIEGERMRIVIDKDGLYKISYSDLQSAGMAGVDPRTFRMTNQGLDVAITVVGEEDGILNQEDHILFYGEAFRGNTMAAWYSDESLNWNSYTQQLPDGTTTLWKPEFNATMLEKYTTENIYWLQSAQGEMPLRIGRVDGTPDDNTEMVPPTYRTTVRAERQLIHFERHFTSEDTWFWDEVKDYNTKYYTTTLTALGTEPFTAIVRSEYVARNYSNIVTPDHIVEFYLNGGVAPINISSWDGSSRYGFEAAIPNTLLMDGENQLGFVIKYDSVSPYVYFDWFEIEYERRYVAIDDEINYYREPSGTWRYQLEGFQQAGIHVLDITNPHQPLEVTNSVESFDGVAYRTEFQYTNNTGIQLYAASAIRTPRSISLYTPPDLRSTSNGADILIITPAEFITTAQRLADYRGSQGLRVRIVNLNDLYDEFNEGIYHPIAVKNFLEYTFAYWTPPAPMYVILVGDGHWNLLGSNPAYGDDPVYMPPYLGWVDSTQGEVDSSNLLATIVGDDPLPDVLIGRIPVNSDQELDNVIDKIIAFEQTPRAEWQWNNTFIADNTPDAAGDFVAMANLIISNYIESGYTPIRIYLDDFIDFGLCGTPPYSGGPLCPSANAEIVETLNTTGTLFATYIGHASVQNWAHERIFLYHLDDPTNPYDMYYSDIDALNNDDQLPIVLSMDCLDGYWFHPILQPSLAELFIRSAGHGAVATFSPTGLGVGSGHYSLMQGFFATVYHDGIWELGAAALGAKLQLYTAGYFSEMIQTYTIFGDPALKIPSPYGMAANPLEASQQVYSETEVQYAIEITNTGVLNDVYHLVIEGQTFPTTLSSDTISLAPTDTVEIMVTVNIPEDIQGGVTDTVIVQVVSDGDVAIHIDIILRTILLMKVNLPFLRK
jgi:hypothetical protein